VVEAVFFREVGVYVGDDVLFQWRGTLSVGLTRAPGARGLPSWSEPSVGGQEPQRAPPPGESLRPRIVRDRAGSQAVRPSGWRESPSRASRWPRSKNRRLDRRASNPRARRQYQLRPM